MSALSPIIKAMRALAERANQMGAGQSAKHADLWLEAGWVLNGAADDLEARDLALRTPLDGQDSSFHYDPKGKPPRSSER